MADEMQGGVSVALSPVQLAAVLAHDHVSPDASFTNRLWGGLRTVGGVLELLGAGALCVAPEPTGLTKAGCVVLGAHGADGTATGMRQVYTGQTEASLTESGVAAMARALGASEDAASNIGVAVDVGLPLGIGLAAATARVVAVRGGTLKLALHEAAQGSRVGGHTIARHVGWTEEMLRARVLAKGGPELASSFRTLETAELAVSKALRANRAAIQAWAQRAAGSAQKLPPQAFEADVGHVIGIGVHRRGTALLQLSRVRVVLKYETFNGMPYYVLTAFPIP